MAACGASDSVIAQHQCLLGTAGPSSSLLCFSPRGVLLNRLMLLFSAQCHTLCFTSVTGGLRQSRYWPTQRNENGKKWKKRSLWESLFPFHLRAMMFAISRQNRREGTSSYPSVMHSSIAHIYIYTPCCFVLREERHICKMYL